MRIPVIDFHCDVLSKLQQDPKISFKSDDSLDMSYDKIKAGNIALQCFAIYISEELGQARFKHIAEQIDIFYERVVTQGITPVRTREELTSIQSRQGIGGMLSIEGADALEGDLQLLELCYQQGVRFLGLTWNYANWAADGILEKRNGGLTDAGVKLIQKCHELGIILDVSHLSTKGFWELSELAHVTNRPFIASHSNAIAVCDHVRNLSDKQILDIIKLEGRIGLNFFPPFVTTALHATAEQLLPHIEHMCELGGAKHIMMGSDFDGINQYLRGLENGASYVHLTDLLLRYYQEDLVKGFLYDNAYQFLKLWLPK